MLAAHEQQKKPHNQKERRERTERTTHTRHKRTQTRTQTTTHTPPQPTTHTQSLRGLCACGRGGGEACAAWVVLCARVRVGVPSSLSVFFCVGDWAVSEDGPTEGAIAPQNLTPAQSGFVAGDHPSGLLSTPSVVGLAVGGGRGTASRPEAKRAWNVDPQPILSQ